MPNSHPTAILHGAPGALKATKGLLRNLPGLDWNDALRAAAALSADLFAGAEAAEGMDAFFNKRRPAWDVSAS